MNRLVFKFDNPIGEPDREKILAFAAGSTGYEASLDVGAGELCVYVKKDSDLFLVRDNLIAAAAANGYAISGMPRILEPDAAGNGDGADANPDEKPPKNMPSVSLGTFIAVICVVLLISVLATYALFVKRNREPVTLYPGIYENDGTDKFPELTTIAALFRTYSYLDLDEQAQIDAVLRAYVEATGDRYADYYNKEEYEWELNSSMGTNVGLGVSIMQRTIEAGELQFPALQVVRVFDGSGAQNAGILPGDYLVGTGSGDGIRMIYEYDSMSDFKEALRVPNEGDSLDLVLYRYSSDTEYETICLTLIARTFITPTVFGRVSDEDPTVGIVQITEFNKTTPTYFKNVMNDLIGQGITRIVFDLRGNPGGDQRSIVAVLSYFLNNGDLVMSTKDKAGNTETETVVECKYAGEYAACSVSYDEIGMYRNYRYAVLVNGSTASAAELFTATFRDYGLGLIVGTKTYGKGSMQKYFPLYSMGMEGALKLTTHHYFPPCGEGYDGIGIYPSEGYAVELTEEAQKYSLPLLPEKLDNQLQAAFFAVTAEG